MRALYQLITLTFCTWSLVCGEIIEERTALIYRRYYVIARLNPTMNLIARIHNESDTAQFLYKGKLIDFKMLLPKHECTHIKHSAIRHSITCMHECYSFKPLFMIWELFKSYTALNDELFVEDFTREVFIIIRNIINQLAVYNKHDHVKNYDMQVIAEHGAIEVMLDEIDTMTQYLMQSKHDTCKSRLQVKCVLEVDQIAMRFYCIKRIDRAIAFLLLHASMDMALIKPDITLDDTNTYYETLPQVWEDIRHYKYIENESFMRYFLCNMLLLLHMTIVPQKIIFSKNTALYDHIAEMPIEDLLNAIDAILDTAELINQDYQSSGLAFHVWVKQHWLLIPFLLSTIVFKIIHFYYTHGLTIK